MSTDPTGLGGNCVEATSKKYVNIRFDKNDWCGYDDDCPIDSLLYYDYETCLLCKYRKPIDVPIKLKQKMRQE
jgi:hypothetical protein